MSETIMKLNGKSQFNVMRKSDEFEGRIWRSRSELELQTQEIAFWVEACLDADKLQQYHTQLKALKAMFEQATVELRSMLGRLKNLRQLSDVYVECQKLDKRLVWFRKLWLYYKTKFDQRRHELLKDSLLAADEMVWSCYAEALNNAGKKLGTIPLCYFEPLYTPYAIPRIDPPCDFRNIDSPVLRETIKKMPIPVIALPMVCARSPHWLVYIAHEVGHHIQYDLGLVDVFKNTVMQEVRTQGADEDESKQWGRWAQEIFADLYSLCCIGPAAPSSISELVFSTEDEMLRMQTRYPPALARVTLLQAATNELKTTPAPIPIDMQTFMDEQKTKLSEHGKRIKWATDIAEPLLETSIDGMANIKSLSCYRKADFKPGGTVYRFQKSIKDGDEIAGEESIRSARLIVAAAYRVWHELGRDDSLTDTEKEDRHQKLKEVLYASVIRNRPLGTRAAKEECAKAPDGKDLVHEVFNVPDEELFGPNVDQAKIQKDVDE